jgi:hypothetical protein
MQMEKNYINLKGILRLMILALFPICPCWTSAFAENGHAEDGIVKTQVLSVAQRVLNEREIINSQKSLEKVLIKLFPSGEEPFSKISTIVRNSTLLNKDEAVRVSCYQNRVIIAFIVDFGGFREMINYELSLESGRITKGGISVRIE